MISFYFKEMFKSFGRARLSFIISLITTTISVFFITVSSLLFLWSNVLTDQFNKRTAFSLFLNDQADNDSVKNEILAKLQHMEFTDKIKFVSREDARKNFLAQTGEDFSDVLDYNPLPQSVELRIKSTYLRKESIKEIAAKLQKVEYVDEVVFESGIIYKALDFISSLKLYILIISVILAAISLYIVYSTNRLIIQTRWRQIETMKLVGATLSAIKIPILLTGLFIGLMASLLTFSGIKILQMFVHDYVVLNNSLAAVLVVVTIFAGGPVIGLLGSILAAKKISLKINKLLF